MILFALSLFDLVSDSDYKNNPFLKLKLSSSLNKINSDSQLFNLRFKYNKFSSILLSVNRLVVNQLERESIETKPTYKLINRNFWQKLINKYWQETIFISSSTTSLENYTNRLRSSGLSIYEGNDYKYFLQQFSKDLLNRRINLNATIYNVKDLKDNNNLYVQYKWLKSLNPSVFFIRFNQHRINSNFVIDDSIVSFPLFVLVNEKQQVILSESSEHSQNYQRLWNFYSNLTNKAINKKTLYTGLFFTNLDDAKEYLNYISIKYNKSTRGSNIKLVPTTIKMYYQLLAQVNNNIDFRLVPDLREISELLYKYKKYRHVSFHKDQRYGNNYFQGQPLYFIKSSKLKNFSNVNNFKLLYRFSRNDHVQYEAVFLNYETAFNAWQKYRRKLNNYKLPLNPQIDVLNLETFITTPTYAKQHQNFIFIPPIKTYDFAKKYVKNHLEENKALITSFSRYGVNLKSFMYRVFWSLTTRQPISW